jgi:phosphate transport system substrate-binding protein
MKILSFILSTLISTSVFAGDKLLITGSSTVAPLAKELARKFESENKKIRFDVQTGGSSRGIMDAKRGTNDIGMISRSLKASESDLKAHLIAKDGIAIIVAKSNPIKELKEEQIKKIYTGEITNWKELGGKDARIDVISKAAGRSTLELFLKHFSLKYRDIKASSIIGDNEQAVKALLRSKNAIAYVSIGTAEYHISQNADLKTLALQGVQASSENVKNNTYPLSRELNFVTKKEPEGVLKDFIEFAQSSSAYELIEGQHFVPIQ